MPAELAQHVALIGLRCSGKSSLGARLARELGCPFVDLDAEIVSEFSRKAPKLDGQPLPPWPRSAGELLASVGEREFRALESRVLGAALRHSPARVIATGGGVVEQAQNRRWLAARALCIWLRVPIDELQRRLRSDPNPRPALLGRDAAEELEELELRRSRLYSEVARLTLDCGRLSTAELCARVIGELERARESRGGG
jgi:shikimate kinase